MPEKNFHLRIAQLDDAAALHVLIANSVRGLMTQSYTADQLEAALGTWLGLDAQLIVDGTYFIIEADVDGVLQLVACGGWSRRKTPYGSDHRPDREDSLLDTRTDAAKIRAFFIHPQWSRMGLGTMLLNKCEHAAISEGFTKLEMGATLSGIPLYERHGYSRGEMVELPLRGGGSLPIVRMGKQIA